jgi:hypothetical protein
VVPEYSHHGSSILIFHQRNGKSSHMSSLCRKAEGKSSTWNIGLG